MSNEINEITVRAMIECPACHQEKAIGLVVCWQCWQEYKHYDGTLAEFCHNSPRYEKLPNRCLNDQRLGNVACQFCGISMYHPGKGFTCEA